MKKRKNSRLRKQIRYLSRWALVVIIETIMAAVPTALLAVIIVPLANASREHFDIGGEWLVLELVFYITFVIIHNKLCDAIYGKEKRMAFYKTCEYCGSNLDPGERCDCNQQKQKTGSGKGGGSIAGINTQAASGKVSRRSNQPGGMGMRKEIRGKKARYDY